ncbi:MAG: response regulator [Elusimicrobia bacterium]|nr:response regulator [Elusimicrobiota bacterium]
MAKILVIDDEQPIVELLSLRLTEAGHQVVVAMDGLSAPMIASREKPDLVILDFNMPAANGAKVHERLRGNTFTATTPIIFLTASPIGQVMPQVKDDDITRFLQKPVDFPLLAKMMASFLPGSTPPPAAPAAAPPPPPPDILDLD